MANSRSTPKYKQLRARANGQIIGDYTDGQGNPRNDWNDLNRNSQYLHEVGKLIGGATAIDPAQLTFPNINGPQRETEVFFPIDLHPGYSHIAVILELSITGIEVSNLTLYRDGSKVVLDQFAWSGNGLRPFDSYVLPIQLSKTKIYLQYKLSSSVRPQSGRIERAYIGYKKNLFGGGTLIESGLYSIQVVNYKVCETL